MRSQIAAKIHSTGNEGSSAAGGVKRPLEDNMNGVADGTPEVKKMAPNDPYGGQQVASVQRNGADFVIEEYHVPDKMVGLIIGKGGEQILRLQAETGCKIQLAPDSGGAPERPCTLTGSRESVQKVKGLINQIIAKANSPFPPDNSGSHIDGQYTAEMMIPGPKVGLLIGKGGENIKNLQEKGGVKMVLIQDGPQQTIHEKPLRITGDPQKVEFAKQMVIDLLAQKDMERFANGAGAQEELMVPRQAVGVVIGKNGEMIKRIQNDSGARVQFIQGKEDIPGDKLCQITGHIDQVQKATAMIQELIQSVLMGVTDGRGRGRGRGRGMGGPGMRPDFGPGGPRMRGPPDGPAAEIQFPVPANKCGLVIGKGGETVRSINQQSGAHVEIARGMQPNPHEKLFIIRGNPQQIEHAKQLISERIGLPPGQGGPPGGPPQGPPGQFQPQYPQQFQQPGPGQPYGAPGWGNPYQQWSGQPASAGVAVTPSDPTKVGVDPNAAAWAAYYAQFYGQPTQPQPGQMQPQPQPQPTPAAAPPAAATAPATASAPAGQPDYSAAWAEYYRSLGMYKEAEMIEQQARMNQAQAGQPSAGATGANPSMGPPNPAGGPAPGQPGAPPPQSVTPAGTPGPAPGAPGYPGVYSQPSQQPAPGQVPYGGAYPGYNYAPYGAQQQFAAPAQQ